MFISGVMWNPHVSEVIANAWVDLARATEAELQLPCLVHVSERACWVGARHHGTDFNFSGLFVSIFCERFDKVSLWSTTGELYKHEDRSLRWTQITWGQG